MQVATTPQKLTMTYEQFRQWAGEDAFAEWGDGEGIIPMPPKRKHQSIALLLARLLREFVEVTGQGEASTAPFEVFLPSRPASREPDIIVVLGDNLQHLTEERFTGAPDLVVEVVLEDSVRRDRVEKFLEYERDGVKEYWLVDSRSGHAGGEVFALEQGSFVPLSVDEAGWLASQVLPGFRVKPSWFGGEALPEVSASLGEMLSPEMKERLIQRLGTE